MLCNNYNLKQMKFSNLQYLLQKKYKVKDGYQNNQLLKLMINIKNLVIY